MGDIASNLVGHWKLDDNAASTVVVGTVGGNGTLNGGDNTSAKTIAGPGGSLTAGLNFNGTDDYVALPVGTLLRNVGASSLACWIKTSATGDDRAVSVGTNTAGSVRALIYFPAGLGQIRVGGRAGDGEAFQSVTSVSNYNNNAWRHVAGVFNYASDSILIYVDGATVSTTGTPSFTATSTSDTNPSHARIGSATGEAGATGSFWQGGLADVRIYSRALAAEDVADLYALGVSSSFNPAWARNSNILIGSH